MPGFNTEHTDRSLSCVELFRQLHVKSREGLEKVLNASQEPGSTFRFCSCSALTPARVALCTVHQSSLSQSEKQTHATNLTKRIHMKDRRHSPEWPVRLSYHFTCKPTHLQIIYLHVCGQLGEQDTDTEYSNTSPVIFMKHELVIPQKHGTFSIHFNLCFYFIFLSTDAGD